MKAKHTPGPWKIGEQYLGCRDIFAPMPGDEPNIEICSTSGLPEEEDDIANARLIAAAPDLLAALFSVKVWLHFFARDVGTDREETMVKAVTPVIQELESALAKAKA